MKRVLIVLLALSLTACSGRDFVTGAAVGVIVMAALDGGHHHHHGHYYRPTYVVRSHYHGHHYHHCYD